MVMMRVFLLAIFLLLNLADGMAASPVVTAQIEPSVKLDEGYLEGKISVYHSVNEAIDADSFKMEGEPLAVEFLFDAKITPEERARLPQFQATDIVSIYRFRIPGKPKGLYLLPSIALTINQKPIQSFPTTYTVTTQTSTPALKLEPITDPQLSLYPGQRTHLGYRITFTEPTELTTEELPLIKPEGFTKIGQEEINTKDFKTYSTQTISQEVRALTPGTYAFPESRIEGRTFNEDAKGRRVYDKRLKATVPPFQIIVKPFPEKNKPFGFSGGLGQFILNAHLITAKNLMAGDEIRLLIRLTGQGEFDTLRMPNLSCQPGFSGFFQMSDFPPKERTDAFSKEFTVELRPLSSLVQSVPSIEFSYFDPHANNYVVLRSRAIPIQVEAPLVSLPQQQTPAEKAPATQGEWRQSWGRAQASDLSLDVLPSDEALTSYQGVQGWHLWLLTGVGSVLLGLQFVLRQYWSERLLQKPIPNSQDYLQMAKQHLDKPESLSQDLERALKLLLVEEGLTRPDMPVDALPALGPVKPIKEFLMQLQKSRYGGIQQAQPVALVTEAESLFLLFRPQAIQ